MAIDWPAELVKAQRVLHKKFHFWGHLILYAPLEEDAGLPAPGATDGHKVLFNCALMEQYGFVGKYTKTVLAHEVDHCAFGHGKRRGSRDPLLWNYACDAETNYRLEQAGFLWPKGFSPVPGEDDVAEVIYERYMQNRGAMRGTVMSDLAEGSGADTGSATGAGAASGVAAPAPSKPPSTAASPSPAGQEGAGDNDGQEVNWKQVISDAAAIARGQGTLPGSMSEIADKALQPKVDWRRVVIRHAKRALRESLSFDRLNRRVQWQGLYLPGPKQTHRTLAMVLDTSGSMGQEALRQGMGEVWGMLRANKNLKLVIIHADAQVQAVFHHPNEVKKFMGRGGTDFRPAFNYIEKERIRPDMLVYFTDGQGSFPRRAPRYPVIWAMTTKERVPWGIRVQVI